MAAFLGPRGWLRKSVIGATVTTVIGLIGTASWSMVVSASNWVVHIDRTTLIQTGAIESNKQLILSNKVDTDNQIRDMKEDISDIRNTAHQILNIENRKRH